MHYRRLLTSMLLAAAGSAGCSDSTAPDMVPAVTLQVAPLVDPSALYGPDAASVTVERTTLRVTGVIVAPCSSTRADASVSEAAGDIVLTLVIRPTAQVCGAAISWFSYVASVRDFSSQARRLTVLHATEILGVTGAPKAVLSVALNPRSP